MEAKGFRLRFSRHELRHLSMTPMGLANGSCSKPALRGEAASELPASHDCGKFARTSPQRGVLTAIPLFKGVAGLYAGLMQGQTQKNGIGTRKSTGSRMVFLLGIVNGVVLTLLCEGIWLAYFVWHHHMFIFGVNGRGAALAAVLVGLVATGAVLLIKAVRRIRV
jgi:hypothetical protein